MAETAKTTISLNRAMSFSECRGERLPDDPHYRVHFFQGYRLGKKLIMLPFDAHGELVEDDGRTSAYTGLVEGKPVTYSPLYTADMRALVTKLEAIKPEQDGEEEDPEPVIAGSDDPAGVSKNVDLRAWLRGQINLRMPEVRAAVQAQFGNNPQNFKEAVEFLVDDEGIVTRDAITAGFRRFLPQN